MDFLLSVVNYLFYFVQNSNEVSVDFLYVIIFFMFFVIITLFGLNILTIFFKSIRNK